MGERYLIDSDVIIDFCNGKLSPGGRSFLEGIEPEISIITNIELFATKNISQQEYQLLERFVGITIIHPVNTDLVNATIGIRQACKLKLPDAIIAATALVFDLVLLSRNISDFKKVEGLQVVDPYEL
jgi:predicted nucleic acid-binding protein